MKSARPFSLLWSLYHYRIPRILLEIFVPMWLVEWSEARYGMVLVFKNKPVIDFTDVKLLLDPLGRLQKISEAQVHPLTGDLFIGSFHNKFLAILPHEHLQEVLHTWG